MWLATVAFEVKSTQESKAKKKRLADHPAAVMVWWGVRDSFFPQRSENHGKLFSRHYERTNNEVPDRKPVEWKLLDFEFN
ncbi:hypothetical protein TNCV_4623361 [Trichonephila clavipes]|nr:hypothetical protein TNCV_4623361 [Trichonephila clavipes]